MATKYYAVLTNVGAAKLANATALGAQVEITQMAVGDGNGALPTPNQAQTALVHELHHAPLNTLSIDPNNANQIIAEQVIPEDVGGWWIREIGLFDKDGDMIAVANCAETYKPQLQEGSGRVQIVRMILIVSNTAAVTLKIDPSVVLATRAYVDSQIIIAKSYADDLMDTHLANANPHDQYPLIANALKEMADAGLVDEVLKNLGLGDAAGYVGRKVAEKWITASGTYTPTPGTKKIRVTIIGGGGGGGSGQTNSAGYVSAGSGGGAGGVARKTIDVTSVSSVSVTIGSGGNPGVFSSSQPGGGGTTSFGSYMTAGGGGRGSNCGSVAFGVTKLIANGGGGVGSGGDINTIGGSGGPAIILGQGYTSGGGGNSIVAGGGQPIATTESVSGIDGSYGSGGSGAYILASGSEKNGGRGGDGVCIVEEFA
ncbi:phage tail protein [Kluyvera ascorbata]|uniref:phage tail protein n=1 Tax=Kluyvera ascorbata TaxID=51288 RepID=UPI0035CD020B